MFRAPKPQAREETPEEKAAWMVIRQIVNDLDLMPDQTFELPGKITAIKGDPSDDTGQTPIWKEVQVGPEGKKRKENMPHLNVQVKLDDPRLAALTFRKDMRISFFDGRMRNSESRSPFRGAFYHIHRAATGFEPSPALVNGDADFDPAEYCNIPMRVIFLYKGRVKEGDKYFGRTANITVFLDHFEPSKETARKARLADDANDGYGVDLAAPTGQVRIVDTPVDLAAKPQQTALPVEVAAAPADPSLQRATERQVKFIFAVGREAGMDVDAVQNWSMELYTQEVEELNRRDASTLIEALQRKRNEAAIAAPESEPVGDELGLPA